jgi:hypothetical protein
MENIGFFHFSPILRNPDMNVNKGLEGASDKES